MADNAVGVNVPAGFIPAVPAAQVGQVAVVVARRDVRRERVFLQPERLEIRERFAVEAADEWNHVRIGAWRGALCARPAVAHARFVEVAAKVNTLLDIAQVNLGQAGATYVATDAAAAGTYGGF